MSNRTERKIGLGWTAEGYRVVALVALEPPENDRVQQYTDHVERAKPERVSVSFEVVDMRRGHSDNRGSWISGGQTPAEDRVIVRRHENDATEEERAFIEQVWVDHHLSDMNAACDHMTPEMLEPADDVLEAYVIAYREKRGEWREKYSPAFYGRQNQVQKWRLDNVVCPETGYRWGHAWLAKTVPDDVLAKVRTLIESGHLTKESL